MSYTTPVKISHYITGTEVKVGIKLKTTNGALNLVNSFINHKIISRSFIIIEFMKTTYKNNNTI